MTFDHRQPLQMPVSKVNTEAGNTYLTCDLYKKVFKLSKIINVFRDTVFMYLHNRNSLYRCLYDVL